MYCICSCCINLFSFQIKPFYTDVFYLHSLWSYLQRLAEIEQTGRKPLTIQRERFIDMDKIFSIAPLIDKSFLNISIKKSCTLRRYSFFYVIPLRFERKTHALEGRCSIQLSYGTSLNCGAKVRFFTNIANFCITFFRYLCIKGSFAT